MWIAARLVLSRRGGKNGYEIRGTNQWINDRRMLSDIDVPNRSPHSNFQKPTVSAHHGEGSSHSSRLPISSSPLTPAAPSWHPAQPAYQRSSNLLHYILLPLNESVSLILPPPGLDLMPDSPHSCLIPDPGTAEHVELPTQSHHPPLQLVVRELKLKVLHLQVMAELPPEPHSALLGFLRCDGGARTAQTGCHAVSIARQR